MTMDESTSKSADERKAPFRIGDRVTQRGCEHFGVLTVTDVEWIVRTAPGIAPYWLVTAAQDQAPQQDHPPGTCGIVVAGDSRASADRFTLAAGFTRAHHGETMTDLHKGAEAALHAYRKKWHDTIEQRDAGIRDRDALAEDLAFVRKHRDELINHADGWRARAEAAEAKLAALRAWLVTCAETSEAAYRAKSNGDDYDQDIAPSLAARGRAFREVAERIAANDVPATTQEATIAADSRDGWIGVDFDGTLAHYDGFRGIDILGEPVPAMLERVKAWIGDGRDVRIFTARGCTGGDAQALAYAAISAWCQRHLGRALPITRTKDMHMHELWDDRAVQVVKNTGRRADAATPPAATAAVTDAQRENAVSAVRIQFGERSASPEEVVDMVIAALAATASTATKEAT